MKADFNRGLKVSLLFYSEEDGKRALVDKWAIEIGKKYIIGRKKKKVDISIQDITISRIHSEFIFYDKDKIMVKDFGSSNGTFINSQRIEPNKEFYFSIRETLSIGDVKNELIFAIEKNEEEAINRNDFDNIIERKNINEQFKPIKISKSKKNYFEKENLKQEENINEEEKENIKQEENIIKDEKIIKEEKIKNEENNKNIKYKRERSKSFHKDSSSHRNNSYEKNQYLDEKEQEDKINYRNKYRVDKYNNYKDKYENNNYKKNRKNYRSRSRSNSISFRKPYDKPNTRFRKFKKIHSNNSSNSSKKSEKSSKKNKHKNILSYIIKREEEIEKENDKRQIKLYNQYLKIKEEVDAKSEISNLPNLLPVLTAKSKYDRDSSYSEDSIKSREVIRLPNFMKRKSNTGSNRYYNKFDRNEYMNKKSRRYSLRYRHSNKLKKYYN